MYFFSALLYRLKRLLAAMRAPLENPMDAGPAPGYEEDQNESD